MLCERVSLSDPAYPVNAWPQLRTGANAKRADVSIVREAAECDGGDFLFLISCHRIIKRDVRARYRCNLVTHASDLPRGQGWSPMAWVRRALRGPPPGLLRKERLCRACRTEGPA